MTLHEIALTLHSYLRWIVVVAGALVLGRAIAGARAKRPWTATDTKTLIIFLRVLDVQVLLGLFMYFATSALGVRMAAHAGEAMKASTLRFFFLEHFFGMFTATAILHAGTGRLKRRGDAPERHRGTAIVVGIAFAIVLLTIPWPFFPYGRALFRGLF